MKRLFIFISVAVVIGAIVIGLFYNQSKKPATAFESATKIVEINTTNFDVLKEILVNDSIISDLASFEVTAKMKNFDVINPGRFEFKKGESNSSIINKIKSGNQKPKRIRIEGVRSIEQLAGLLGSNLYSDSSAFISAFHDPALLDSLGLTKATIATVISPNTYEFYWTISPQHFISKMLNYHNAYWTAEKTEKAKKIGLTREEVYTLASIVKGETVDRSEAKRIAGLYINRLRIGMKLQADPTLTFEKYTGRLDRVTLSNASKTSKYNTYEHVGLPPGPIYFSEPFYLDAVLDYESHNYLYLCAVPGGGKHAFTSSGDQHYKNAAAYHRWLNSRE